MEYESLEEYFHNFTIKEISSDDAQVLIKLFNAQLTERLKNNEHYFFLNESGVVLNPFE